MSHAIAGAIALAVPVFFVLFALTAFLINAIRGSRSDRANREQIENAPKPSRQQLPKKLRARRKR